MINRFVIAFLAVAATAAAQSADMRTRAEITNYEETSTYADVTRVIDGFKATSSLVHTESFGKTEEGRDLPLLVISDPKVTTPEAARKLGRPIVFVQANIHAGEVEGKEAILMLARRMISGDLRQLTRQLVILIAPNYNADGNEKVNVMNRTAAVWSGQRRRHARERQGLRPQSRLHEARHARGAIAGRPDEQVGSARLRRSATTNGSYHANHLTYSPILNPNADCAADRVHALADAGADSRCHAQEPQLAHVLLPATSRRRTAAAAKGSRVDPANPGNVTWRTFDHRPRFGNNYVGLRNRIAILSEAYSYLDFKGRVEVTEDFVEEIYKSVVANAKQIMTLTSQADRVFTAPANANPVELGVSIQIAAADEKVEILVGDVTKQLNPKSGRRNAGDGADVGAGRHEGGTAPSSPRDRTRCRRVGSFQETTPAGSRQRSSGCACTASGSRKLRPTRSSRLNDSRFPK